jgi:hypothetical protein
MNTYTKMVGGYPGRSFYLVAPARHTPPASATACGSKVRWREGRLRVPHPLRRPRRVGPGFVSPRRYA